MPFPPAADGSRELNLRAFLPALLTSGFGFAIAASYLTALAILQRAITVDAVTAAILFAIAGFLGAWAALVAASLLRSRPWSARISGVLFCLIAGTGGFSALFNTLQIVLTHHRLSEVPLRIAILVWAISGAGVTYNVLSIAAPLILPLGLPSILLFAWLIARTPR